ncbi:type II toxin-antitoxin system VapC family toxin [Candidatus Poribacteria bacterium]|nr:type II toxin-antitoxin system VapC family toxin [Candidatus Poribacteria bacterium]
MPSKPRIYIETSVISYLTSRPSSNAGIRGCQYFTRYWWENFAEQQFELVSSPIVQQEVSLGDRGASQKRLDVLEKLTLLDTPREALNFLSDDLINAGALPLKARIDSFHIAITAINNVQYLATWNFKHIANINKIPLIQQVCRKAGYQPPILCTPQQLLMEDF